MLTQLSIENFMISHNSLIPPYSELIVGAYLAYMIIASELFMTMLECSRSLVKTHAIRLTTQPMRNYDMTRAPRKARGQKTREELLFPAQQRPTLSEEATPEKPSPKKKNPSSIGSLDLPNSLAVASPLPMAELGKASSTAWIVSTMRPLASSICPDTFYPWAT